MVPAKRSSFRRRIRIAILVPAVLAVGISVVVFVSLQWKRALAENEERLRTLSQVFAENSASSLAFQNVEDANQILAALHSEKAVKDAILFDREEKVFASYRAPDAVRARPNKPGALGMTEEDGRLVVYQRVEQSGRRYGTLYLRWDLRPVMAELRAYAGGAVLLLVVCVAAALVAGHFLQRDLSNPVQELAHTADTIARDQNLSLRAPVPETAELATLANAFNAMLGRVAEEVQATHAAREQLRLVIDTVPALISYVDASRRYRLVNLTYQRWFQRPESEIVGRTMEDVLGPAAYETIRPHLERALNGARVEFEADAPYRDGGRRWIHAHYLPNVGTSGEVVGVFVLVLDITERKRMEQSLATAHAELERHSQSLERMVDERTARMREVIGELEAFSYSIAHDMRAPLRGMQGFSRLLLEEHSQHLDEDGRSYLKRIVGAADRLDRLIQDVLNYSRVVRQDLVLERVDAHRLVEEIVATYPALQPPTADIRLEGHLPHLWANTAALTQVVSNLLGNAVKFVPRGTKPLVKVRANELVYGTAEAPEKWVRVTVKDNGIGIPKESQSRIFAMFQRLNRPELYEGTGMGLAIVRKAVERMGGRLGVDSAAGQGSEFWFELRAEKPK